MRARVLIVTVALLATVGVQRHVGAADRGVSVPLDAPLAQLPWTIARFEGQPAPELDPAVVAELAVDDYANRSYRGADGAALGLYVGYYERQGQGRTIHSPLNCLPGSGWEPVSISRRRVDVVNHGAIEVNRYVVRKGLERLLILYWYQGRGRVTASEYSTKAWLVADAIQTGRTDGALVRVVSPLADFDEGGEAQAEQRAVEFVRAMFPILSNHLPGSVERTRM